jgi:hypothetical protein
VAACATFEGEGKELEFNFIPLFIFFFLDEKEIPHCVVHN